MTLLIEILILIIIAILSMIGIYYINDSLIIRINRNNVLSFSNSMDLVGLPVITFYQGKHKFNFLLDTGSNRSYINESSGLEFTYTGAKDTFIGAEGKDIECKNATIKLYREELSYEYEVAIADLSAAFTDIKNSTGVNIAGLLGTDFFTKYKYCFDFKELVAYTRN